MGVKYSFCILDLCTPDGRDGLFGIATAARDEWWLGDWGRLFSGRVGEWFRTDLSGDAPISTTYRQPGAHGGRVWYVLGARGTLYRFTDVQSVEPLAVTGPLRRLRLIGEQLVAVGAHGQVLRGDFGAMAPVAGLAAEPTAGRFLVDVVGAGPDDFTVVGRRGEVFHRGATGWADWSPGGADLHVACLADDLLVVGGDGGRVVVREGEAWRAVTVPTRDPIVGLAWHAGALWAATPTQVLRGDLHVLAPIAGPGFGGMLSVGDGLVYCAGVTHLARHDGSGWTPIPHPDQTYQGPPLPWLVLGDALDRAVAPKRDPAAHLGGRLFAAGAIGAQDLARWQKVGGRQAPVADMLADPGIYRVLEVDGDLHVKGDLSTVDAQLTGLVVHGDLIVDGVFRDCDHPQTLTLVGGALRARTIITSGQLEVGGAVTCEHLIGDYNDFSAELRGPVTARLFFAENHHFGFASRPAFELVIGDAAVHRVPAAAKAAISKSDGAALRAALAKAFLSGDDDELEVDRDKLLAALRDGRSIWRAGTARKPSSKPKPKKPAKRPAPKRR